MNGVSHIKDLDFIRTVVKEWPEGAETVRLDADGEICFTGAGVGFDFYPENIEAAQLDFVPSAWPLTIGARYTREQWAQPATDPVIEALKAGLTPEQYNALKSSRDGLQLQADAGRAGFIAGAKLSMGDRETNADDYANRVKAGEL